MADESQNQQAGQSSTTRARRIRDKEWEVFRPKIENLYQQQGYSRNAVIEKLSQEGFPVTEKQFKHILKKWGTKKKLSSADLQGMLAVKRKRNEDGKATEFKYHGHVVGEAKLQRAEKKYKISTSSNVALPSYIEPSSPNPSKRCPLPSQAIGQNSGIDYLLPSLTNPSLPSHNLFDESYFNAAGQQLITYPLNEADLGTSFFQVAKNEPCWNTNVAQTDHTEELPFHATRTSTSMNNDDFDSLFLMEPLANDTSLMIDVCPAFDIPPFANSASRPVFYPRLPTPVSNSVITSPLATPTNPSISGVLFDGHQISSRLDLQPMSFSNQIIFYGTNPENIIPSIQMMRKLFHCLQDDNFQRRHTSLNGMSKSELYREIRSEFLLSKIDDVACWAYQASATTVQQEAAHQSSCMEVQPSAQRRDNNQEQTSQVQARSVSNESNSARLDGTLISSCRIRTDSTTGGTLQIQLRRAPKEISDRDEGDSQTTLTISAIPEIRNRAGAGIYVTIPRISQGLPIYTTIQEFNVVPQNSEIIHCVKMNDLEGVRRLIGEKKASPRDVDPSGNSLLLYAAFPGCTEIFRLLLKWGASTDFFFRSGDGFGLIDFIWLIGFEIWFSTDLGHCRSLTELALANGCLAGESGRLTLRLPSPLFFLSRTLKKKTTRRQVADTLKQLFWAGYEKEVRNDNGETALLYAASGLRQRSLTVLELLLAEDTNIHAVDNQGRGALHLCLWFSSGLQVNFIQVCRDPSSAHNGLFVAGRFNTTDTFEDRRLYLQHSDSDVEEVLPSDDIDGHIDEESDVDCAECDGEDLYDDPYDSVRSHRCYWCGESNGIERGRFTDNAALFEDDPECFNYCADRDIDDFNMPETPDPEPSPWMCKARSRLKLLALLKAGCCPNILDCEGLSPSDYARAEGLWPQWEWALSKSGFQYNETVDAWERES